jgi:hypothetical protein
MKVSQPKIETLLKNHTGQYRYQFNWIGGGFNDIWAKNLTEFKSELKRKFGNTSLQVNYDSLHKATDSTARKWDKAGDMECW